MLVNFHEKIITDLKNFKSPIRQLSYDKTNKVYLVNIKDSAYNLDAFTKKVYTSNKIDPPCSNDVLLLTEKYDYLIEFKNQEERNLGTDDLINKNFSSITTLLAKNLTDIATLKERYIYLLVYNNDKLSVKDEMNNLLAKNTPYPKKLDYFKKHYFHNIEAFATPTEFENYYLKHIMNSINNEELIKS